MNEEARVTRWKLPDGELEDDEMRRTRRARRKLRALVEQLDLPLYRTVEELCEQLGKQRERPIRLIAREEPAETVGACERYLHEDRIYYPAHTSAAHQAHIICHEVAHLVLAHEPELTAIDPEVALLVLGRSHYEDPAEEQAEVLGTLLWQKLTLAPRSAAAAALEHRRSGHV